jgi:hypothetical protein
MSPIDYLASEAKCAYKFSRSFLIWRRNLRHPSPPPGELDADLQVHAKKILGTGAARGARESAQLQLLGSTWAKAWP